MNQKILALALSTTLLLPFTAQAEDFTIINNTDSYGTIKIGYTPCSSYLGSTGIISPHETHVFSHALMKMACGKSCTAYFYPNKNCSGTSPGNANLDEKVGVVSYQNNDPEHYKVSGSGFNFTVDPVSQGLFGWIKRFV